MNLKKWLYLFTTTLLIGGAASVLMGIIFERGILWNSGISNILIGLVWNLGLGLTFSLISQMGFFAYLTLHNFGLGLFRSLWPSVQVLLIAFTFFDFVYFRYSAFSGPGESFVSYLWLPLVLLLFALIVSYFKVKQTNSKAAIPTVFLLFVVTIIEWMPALRENNVTGMFYMLIPLLLCNTWQVLLLHRLTQKPAAPAATQPAKKKR